MADRKQAPRCPKCRQNPIEYVEMWKGHTISFSVKVNGAPEDEGYLNPGDPYCVWATCKCGHRWRLRKVLQITDLHFDWKERKRMYR